MLEAAAVSAVAERLQGPFGDAVRILSATDRIVVTALGKPGYVAMKLSATLASIGMHAEFIHAAEALHGDSGRLQRGDVLVALSNSGTTKEVVTFASIAKQRECRVISLVGDTHSELATQSDVVLDVSVSQEADPLNLAPTASVMAALAMCDALAVALMLERQTTPHEFYANHPGGALGARLGADPL